MLYQFAGTYKYFEASDLAPGIEARLYSPLLTYGIAKRVQFWYHMFGSTMGGLLLYEVYADMSINTIPKWSIAGGDYTGRCTLLSLYCALLSSIYLLFPSFVKEGKS